MAVTAVMAIAGIIENSTQKSTHNIQFLGPVPAPMEKKAGKYRGQLLVQTDQRKILHYLFNALIKSVEANKAAQRVRWSIDIDPQDLS